MIQQNLFLALGGVVAAASCACGVECTDESPVAPDIVELRQLLSPFLTTLPHQPYWIEYLDENTVRIAGKDGNSVETEWIVKLEDGALIVREYGMPESKFCCMKRGSYAMEGDKKIWVDDEGWEVRRQWRLAADAEKGDIKKIGERVIGNLAYAPGMGEPGQQARAWSMEGMNFSTNGIHLDILVEWKDRAGRMQQDRKYCYCEFRHGRWEIVTPARVAPDVAEIRYMLSPLFTGKINPETIWLLDDETIRLMSKDNDAEWIVRLEDGALMVTEYEVGGKPRRALRGQYREVDGRKVWVDDEGWKIRRQERMAADVKKDELGKIRARMMEDLLRSPDDLVGAIELNGIDCLYLGIWSEAHVSDYGPQKDVWSCTCQYINGKWVMVGMGT